MVGGSAREVICHLLLGAIRIHRLTRCLRHARVIHHVDGLLRWRKRATSNRAYAVQSDQADLVFNVELVLMVSVEEHFEEGNRLVDRH